MGRGRSEEERGVVKTIEFVSDSKIISIKPIIYICTPNLSTCLKRILPFL